MSVSLTGRWSLFVGSAEAGPQRRFIIQGSANADGTYPGNVGTSVDVRGNGSTPWTVNIQNNDGVHGWRDSGMRLDGVVGVAGSTDLTQNIRSEDDPASKEAIWDDIIIVARNLDPLIDVPIRPAALRTDDLQMMPDGVFDTAFGTYYMAVRVENTWGEDFASNTKMCGISAASRAWLAAAGVQVIDTWSGRELESFGQSLGSAGHIMLPALKRYSSRTIFFKLDCSAAQPAKYDVEFECVEAAMVDPASPRRRVTRKIFVSKSQLDVANRELRITCPEGTLTLKLQRIAVPWPYILRNRKRINTSVGGGPGAAAAADDLRKLLQALEAGRKIDICELQRLLMCYCNCRGGRDPNDPNNRRSGKFLYPDFPVWPVAFTYTVEGTPYPGTLGPLPFQDPWWKILLIIVGIILSIAAALSDASDVAYHDSDLVIGELDHWQRDDVDAAVTKLNGNRGLPSPDKTEVLDAQSGESANVPIASLDTDVNVDGNFMSKAEIDALIAAGAPAGLAVFKSGGRSGTTHGLIQSFFTFDRSDPDGNTSHFTIPQLNIVRDPAFNQPTSQEGDSGSLWVHTSSLRMVGLNHSGTADDSGDNAVASLIANVAAALNVKFS